MKIALLNLPIDNNYGGNLQRYALVKTLQSLGHHVCFLETHFCFPGNIFRQLYGVIKRLPKEILSRFRFFSKKYPVSYFLHKKIPHSLPIYNKTFLKCYRNFEVYVVGSDQVWRPKMTMNYGLPTYFFDFLLHKNCKKIAYGVSLGSSECEFSVQEKGMLSKLYSTFNAVSVRERSALNILENCGWTTPAARLVLDPTFLLKREDYEELVHGSRTVAPSGNLFCYMLDWNEEKEKLTRDVALDRGLQPFYVKMERNREMSIEQWLRSFMDANFVVTDSFHGLAFSIIFNKPYVLIKNEQRGNARFENIFSLFEISEDGRNVDWSSVNSKIEKLQKESLDFLREALNEV